MTGAGAPHSADNTPHLLGPMFSLLLSTTPPVHLSGSTFQTTFSRKPVSIHLQASVMLPSLNLSLRLQATSYRLVLTLPFLLQSCLPKLSFRNVLLTCFCICLLVFEQLTHTQVTKSKRYRSVHSGHVAIPTNLQSPRVLSLPPGVTTVTSFL